jgi:hypothetical protein
VATEEGFLLLEQTHTAGALNPAANSPPRTHDPRSSLDEISLQQSWLTIGVLMASIAVTRDHSPAEVSAEHQGACGWSLSGRILPPILAGGRSAA